MLRKRMLLGKC